MTRTVQQLFDLSGKTALVTGGSRGLGLQMAHALGEAGAKIMLTSRKAKDLEEAAAELKAAGLLEPLSPVGEDSQQSLSLDARALASSDDPAYIGREGE